MLNIVTVDMETNLVKAKKLVGNGCRLSECCRVVPNDAPDLFGAYFDMKKGGFYAVEYSDDGGYVVGDLVYALPDQQ